MWRFVSPEIVFGHGALDAVDELAGRRALVVTDRTICDLGLADRVCAHLGKAGIEAHVFAEVEPDPSTQTARAGAARAHDLGPDWIVGLGGGSAMDAAKAIWVLYERPDLEPQDINPFVDLGLRKRARLLTIPTTSGTGAEVTWAIVLTDPDEQRKLGLGNHENVADIAVVDPAMAASMPPALTAETGLDALTHAVEGYTCTWRTDLTDGLCVQAARLIFEFLPRAVCDGTDREARERMANAATCAGLGFGNAMASTAHAMGHALGATFHIPHGRAVALCLPYSIEFAAPVAPGRYAELAAALAPVQSPVDDVAAARGLASRVRALATSVGCPTSIAQMGISAEAFEMHLEKLVDDALNDTQMITACRSPSDEELARLFRCAYAGTPVDF